MQRMVLLQHDLPDGGSHFDWMIARPGADSGADPDERSLLTFRVGERIDAAGCTAFRAERLGDHRRAYLDFEGSLTGGRGVVTRVASGAVHLLEERGGPEPTKIVGAFGAGPVWTWLAHHSGDDCRFSRSS